MCVARYNGDKFDLKWDELSEKIPELLNKIQDGMYVRAKERMDAVTSSASEWNEFMTKLNERKVILTPWCEDRKC